MPDQKLQCIELGYGADRTISFDVASDRVAVYARAPEPLADVPSRLTESLNSPIDFPPLRQCVFPDDHLVLVLDNAFPLADRLVAGIWEEFQAAGIKPHDVTILQSADRHDAPANDPRGLLPEVVRGEIRWQVHTANGEGSCAYLASSASGERVYLARDVVDADVVITIGQIAYDSILGYRGTNSALYPGLSDEEAVRRTHAQGQPELGPDDDRALRTLVDEIGWLLGTQFSIQVLPGGSGGVAQVLAGAHESVLRHGKQFLSQNWLVHLSARCDLAVVSVGAALPGNEWNQLGAALAVARNLVERHGKIVVLSDIDTEPGDGFEIVRESREPVDALQSLRAHAPTDMLAATQLVNAVRWADVYLLSGLPADLVDDLHMTPLEKPAEAVRVVESGNSSAFIEDAQFATGVVGR